MNAYIERILSPGVSISRNVLDEEDEEFHRQRESEIDIENAVLVSMLQKSVIVTKVLMIASSEPAVAFIRATFSENSNMAAIGQIKIHDKAFGTLLHGGGITIFEPLAFKQSIDEHIGYLSQCAVKILDQLKPQNVIILDSLLESKYHHPHLHEEVEPPLSRMLATTRAKDSMTKGDVSLLPYLETGNLIRGLSAAFLVECEARNMWAVIVCSLQNVRWFGSTVVAYLPILEVIKSHCLIDQAVIQGQPEDIRARCLKAQEKVDASVDMIYM